MKVQLAADHMFADLLHPHSVQSLELPQFLFIHAAAQVVLLCWPHPLTIIVLLAVSSV